jgi:hypothetical protein
MSLFPFFEETTTTVQQSELYQEVAWDFEKNKPVLENGTFKIVTGKEAVLSWAYRALQVNRYRLEMYSWDYGNELDKLIGSHYTHALTKAEAIRYIEECLLVNPFVKSLQNVNVDFEGSQLIITCTLETIYGNDTLEGVKVDV